MKQQFLLALFIFLTSLSLNAQEPTFFGQTLHQVSSPTLQEQFHNYQVFQLDVQQLEQYLKYGPEVGRPFQLQIGDDIDWSLELMADDIRSEDYFVSVQQERGLRQKPKGDNITYSGHLLAPEQGRVRLTVHADFLYGRIKTANADWYIEPLDRFHESATPNTYLIYQATDVKHNKKHRCAADDIDQIAEPETTNHAALAVGLCYTVDIALAADFDMFSQFGNTVDTENYMLGILNNVQTDYDDAFADELSYEVVTVFIADCPGCDPWTNSNDAGSVLVSFRDWGNTGGFGPVTYDVATLWTNRNFSGSTLGVAWVGGLCTNLRYNTCQDFTSNASLLRVVQSHELGHNFNSQHDNSTGFIMSPSVNNTNTWSNQSINTINSFVSNFAANSGCLTPCVPVGPPVAGLFTPVTNVCPGSLVPFIDQSQNNPSSWDWQFTNGDPSTSNLQHPLVRYNDIGTFPVSLTVENPSGIDFADGTVTVSENGTKYLLYETFENGLLLWSVDNPDNSTSWQVATVSFANYGNKTVFIDNYNYNNAGQNDYLVSPVVDLSLESNVMLEIDYAYVRYSENNSDQMAIEVSTNGGQSYPFVVFSGQENGSGNFATAPDQTFPFSPGSENDWCYGGGFGSDCLSIDLSQFSGNANFRFRIRNTTDFGNNLYVDNIRLSSSCAIDQPPLADFSADVFVGCVPLAVQFLDETVGPVTDRAWTFEGGSPANSSEKDPFVVYDNAGVFDVSLQVGNPAGFSLETKEDFVIALGEPIVAFTTSTNGLEVSFENQTTDGLDYEWEFGDGNTSQEENPVHTYASPGTYTVRLSATNDCGTVVLDQEVVVEASLEASFTQDVSSGCVPFMVQFTDTSIGEIQTWEWTFEQGNPATSTNQNQIVEYQQAGVFDVQLIVSDGNLQDTFYMAALITADTLPTAAFDIGYNLGEPIATFTNEAIAADSLFWDFGDGSTSLAENPQHTYSQDGTYTIQLIAKNDCGSDTTEQELTIISFPKGSINADTTAGCLPFSVQFDANSSNGATFFWEFEGGTPNTSNEANPSVTYNQAGTFDVYLTVNNAAGTLTDTLTDYITVQDIPTAAFSIDYMLGETSAAFANESIGADSYAWDFGDGNTSTDENPSHDYGTDGTYTVQLIATNACGSDTTEQVIEIVTEPTASISADVQEGCAPLSVAYNSNSPNGTTFEWTFEGGTPESSTASNPTVLYESAGTFGVSLTVSNAAGQIVLNETDYITVGEAPTAAFSIDYMLGETSAAFANESIGGVSYAWDFGDGNTSTDENPSHDYGTDGTYTVQLIATNACGSDTTEQVIEVVTEPTASISADVQEGCAPLSVQYNSNSPNGTTFEWTFEGGTPESSTASNPTVLYESAGTFGVSLTVSNAAGQIVLSETDYITVGEAPTAAFSIDYMLGETVAAFANESIRAESYAWDFGDGNTSTDENPSHDYGMDGTYTVQLIATNACGSDTTEQVIEVVTEPTASISADVQEGCAPLSIQYNSNSPNGTTFEWTFEGGTPENSTASNPTVLYESAGTFGVSLTVSNAAGQIVLSETDYITVGEAPTAAFNIDYMLGETSAAFTNESIGGESYAWDFGDGNTSSDENPSHDYGMDGTYTVQLIATNACGSDTTEQVIEVVTEPTASISADVQEGCAPLSVQYNSNSPNGTTFEWTFEGGTPESSTASNPTVLYESAGTFGVSLTVSNAAGQIVLSETDYITVGEAPTAAFSIDYMLGETSAAFANESIGAESYAWDFGDGNTSTDENPSHDYGTDGTYTVQLIATNACGSDTTEQVIAVVTEPTASISADVQEGCAPLSVQYNSNSPNGTTFEWTFEGGTPESSTASNPTVLYESAGTFGVSLTVSNAAGQIVLSETNYITVGEAPTAAFSIDYMLGETSAAFANESIGADSYAWNFGDGNTSSDENPSHDYGMDGTYTVQLIAINACGSDTTEQVIEIVTEPTASISADVQEGCAPLSVQYNSNSSNGTTFEWTFEGGTPESSTASNPTVLYESAGTFGVSLTVSNAAGQIVLSETNYITVGEAPTAAFSIDYMLGETVAAFANESIGADSYAWDFGDGNTSTDENPSHDYGMDGTYTVQLIATNACGSDTTEQVIEVVTEPTASISADVQEGCAPLSVQYNSNSPNGTTFEWTFEGGTPESSTASNPTVLYESAGTFGVSLTVSNAAGEVTFDATDFIEVGTLPEAGFVYDYEIGETIVDFTNTSENADNYIWHFGDGISGVDIDPTHIYESDGVYLVQLIAMNECGMDTMSQEIEIITPPQAMIEANIQEGCAPMTVEYQAVSGNGVTFDWTFEGGEPATSNQQNPTVLYAQTGTYGVTLVVSNAAGDTVVTVSEFIVVDSLPNANFESMVDGLELSLMNSSTGADEYFWDFGDGATSNMENPTHAYENAGDYMVTLLAINDCGADTLMQEVQIMPNQITPMEALQMDIYPNPTNGSFWVDIKGMEGNGRLEMAIFDLAGRQLKPLLEANAILPFHQRYEISDLPKGVYIIRASWQNKLIHKRLIIQ